MNGRIWWQPPSPEAQIVAAVGALLLMGLAATALAIAPIWLPPDYSPIRQSVSDAAAQSLPNAWISRLGFLTFGQAVLWLAAAFQHRWARIAWWPHALFGVFMMAAATFSARPWLPQVATDEFEAGLHTFAVTAWGIAFALGTAARGAQRWREREAGSAFDFGAAVVSVLLPLAALALPERLGILQRALLLLAFAWYAREAVTALRGRFA